MTTQHDHFSEYSSRFLDDAAPPGMTFGEVDEARKTQLKLTPIAEFAAVDEETAKPMMGDEETCLLSHGGTLKMYGDGGAGKTTLEVDFLCHLAAGDDWLGLNVPERVKTLIIENEGPRGMFRKKLRRKLESWQGSNIGDRIHVLEDPWALFKFDEEVFRQHLRTAITQHEYDLVAAGPVQSLGIKGGGTPEEVAAFMYCVTQVRHELDRPIAMAFVGHENKAGDVAGAWEGVPDTLMHLSNQGNGSTRLYWQKVRWGAALHGKTWQLAWDDGETFTLVEQEVRSDSEIEADMVAFVTQNPGCSWRQIRDNVEGNLQRMAHLRDDMIRTSKLENRGAANKMALFVGGSVVPVVPPAWNKEKTHDGTAHVVSETDKWFPGSAYKGEPLIREPHEDENQENGELDFGTRSFDADGDIPF